MANIIITNLQNSKTHAFKLHLNACDTLTILESEIDSMLIDAISIECKNRKDLNLISNFVSIQYPDLFIKKNKTNIVISEYQCDVF